MRRRAVLAGLGAALVAPLVPQLVHADELNVAHWFYESWERWIHKSLGKPWFADNLRQRLNQLHEDTDLIRALGRFGEETELLTKYSFGLNYPYALLSNVWYTLPNGTSIVMGDCTSFPDVKRQQIQWTS